MDNRENKTEYTMEDIVELVNNSEHEFIIHVEFEEEDAYGKREKSI